MPSNRPSWRLRLALLLLLGLASTASLAGAADTETPKIPTPPAVFDKLAPEGVEDLKAIQEHVKKVLDKVVPVTVGVRVGQAQGSGVIVSEDGYVLTAGHVSGKPGQDVVVLLADGRKVKGKTLGQNRSIDSGLIKISDEGKWPFAEMGKSADLKKGHWAVTVGHPGGYRPDRTPVVRLGRVLFTNATVVQTDCTLVGGDSGGPLFDMNGKVVGIHSRIGPLITFNMHVPVDTYRETWDRLAKGEAWGSGIGGRPTAEPYLGVRGKTGDKEWKITEVVEGSPAAQAGLKVDDKIISFNGDKVETFDELLAQVGKKRVNDEVTLGVIRGDETLTIKVKLARKPN
jgi:serine protease Do